MTDPSGGLRPSPPDPAYELLVELGAPALPANRFYRVHRYAQPTDDEPGIYVELWEVPAEPNERGYIDPKRLGHEKVYEDTVSPATDVADAAKRLVRRVTYAETLALVLGDHGPGASLPTGRQRPSWG